MKKTEGTVCVKCAACGKVFYIAGTVTKCYGTYTVIPKESKNECPVCKLVNRFVIVI